MTAELATPANTIGLCHTCCARAPLTFKPTVGHWLCEYCDWRIGPRGTNFLANLMYSRDPRRQCCGPGVEVRHA